MKTSVDGDPILNKFVGGSGVPHIRGLGRSLFPKRMQIVRERLVRVVVEPESMGVELVLPVIVEGRGGTVAPPDPAGFFHRCVLASLPAGSESHIGATPPWSVLQCVVQYLIY